MRDSTKQLDFVTVMVLLLVLVLVVSLLPIGGCEAKEVGPVVNRTYVDVILSRADITEDFTGSDQLGWRFLRRLCLMSSSSIDALPSSPLRDDKIRTFYDYVKTKEAALRREQYELQQHQSRDATHKDMHVLPFLSHQLCLPLSSNKYMRGIVRSGGDVSSGGGGGLTPLEELPLREMPAVNIKPTTTTITTAGVGAVLPYFDGVRFVTTLVFQGMDQALQEILNSLADPDPAPGDTAKLAHLATTFGFPANPATGTANLSAFSTSEQEQFESMRQLLRERRELLGVVEVHVLSNAAVSGLYSRTSSRRPAGVGLSSSASPESNSEDGRGLSAGWTTVTVMGTILVLAVVYTFAYRHNQIGNKASPDDDAESDAEDEMQQQQQQEDGESDHSAKKVNANMRRGVDAAEAPASQNNPHGVFSNKKEAEAVLSRWEEPDLEGDMSECVERAAQERDQIRKMREFDLRAVQAQERDTFAAAIAALSAAAADAAAYQTTSAAAMMPTMGFGRGRKKKKGDNDADDEVKSGRNTHHSGAPNDGGGTAWSANNLAEALALDPSLALPPDLSTISALPSAGTTKRPKTEFISEKDTVQDHVVSKNKASKRSRKKKQNRGDDGAQQQQEYLFDEDTDDDGDAAADGGESSIGAGGGGGLLGDGALTSEDMPQLPPSGGGSNNYYSAEQNRMLMRNRNLQRGPDGHEFVGDMASGDMARPLGLAARRMAHAMSATSSTTSFRITTNPTSSSQQQQQYHPAGARNSMAAMVASSRQRRRPKVLFAAHTTTTTTPATTSEERRDENENGNYDEEYQAYGDGCDDDYSYHPPRPEVATTAGDREEGNCGGSGGSGLLVVPAATAATATTRGGASAAAAGSVGVGRTSTVVNVKPPSRTAMFRHPNDSVGDDENSYGEGQFDEVQQRQNQRHVDFDESLL